MSYWRNFMRGLFKVSFVISLIGVAVAGIALMNGYSNGFLPGLLTIIVGGIAVVVIHGALGMHIEMCDNIAEIRDKINASAQLTTRASTTPDEIMLSECWKCIKCGEENAAQRSFCGSCGAGKE